jgi:hypothetical protein
MQNNVLQYAGNVAPPPITAANINEPSYTNFYVLDVETSYILDYIRPSVNNEFKLIEKYSVCKPANMIEFLERKNHGEFDYLDNPHLVIVQNKVDITVLALML